MLDPSRLYPKGWHPVETFMSARYAGFTSHITRTKWWPRYYVIDFGFSLRHDPSKLPFDALVAAVDRSAPEFADGYADRATTYFVGGPL
ncbi:hypothetical protein IW262DRAFT_271666 [Armillaria fumosa]|nr:hypothetical protein IW262DRAFT_271666 [Armillaria fumosa]